MVSLQEIFSRPTSPPVFSSEVGMTSPEVVMTSPEVVRSPPEVKMMSPEVVMTSPEVSAYETFWLWEGN